MLGLMAEDQEPAVAGRLLQQLRLLLQRTPHVEVGGRDPGQPQVGALRHQIAGDGTGELVGVPEDDQLVPWRVAPRLADHEPRDDLGLPFDEFEQPGVRHGEQILLEVGGPGAWIGSKREVPFLTLNDMPGAGEGQLVTAVRTPPGQPAGVVPVQMGCDHHVDLLGADPETAERREQPVRLPYPVAARQLLVQLGPDPGLADDHPAAMPDDYGHAGAPDQVVLVRGSLLLPEDFWHDAEEAAPVGAPAPGGHHVQLEVAQSHLDKVAPDAYRK